MPQKPLLIGTYRHKFIGQVEVTEDCVEMEKSNPDPSSQIVEYGYKGHLIEVTLALLEKVESC